MENIDSVGVITGIVILVIGISLLCVSFFFIFALIYALPALIIGIVILLTLKEQDAIEPIKETKGIKRSRGRR